MPTKKELEEKVKKLELKIKDLKKNNDYLLKQQNIFKEMAETAGSRLALYKQAVMRLEEEISKIKEKKKNVRLNTKSN